MLAIASTVGGVAARASPASFRKSSARARSPAVVVVARATGSSRSSTPSSSSETDAAPPPTPSRRETLALSLATATAAILPALARANPALAAYGVDAGGGEGASSGPVTFATFYGAASPPATYGYLGGTTPDKAKYSYDVPSDWVEEAPSKVEKGAGGQDSRWVKSGSRGAVRAVCLTLNRAGEDGAAFDLTDKALNAIAGADAKLQEAITTGEIKRSVTKSGADAREYASFDISGGATGSSYGVKITVDNTGRLFAFVVSAPDRAYAAERATLGRMLDSFRTYDSASQFV